jgi:hypothetical protein
MESDKRIRTPTIFLWWVAFIAEAIAATLEIPERRYLQVAGMYCLALAFLLLATGGAAADSRWRRRMVYLLASVSICLLLYRLL